MVRGALDLIRGQSEELRSHIGEFQRQLGAVAAPSTRAASGHDSAHEPGHSGLDPGEHVVGAPRRVLRRPVRGAAAAFPRIPPQVGRAGRRQARRRVRQRSRRRRRPSEVYSLIHGGWREEAQPEGRRRRKTAQMLELKVCTAPWRGTESS